MLLFEKDVGEEICRVNDVWVFALCKVEVAESAISFYFIEIAHSLPIARSIVFNIILCSVFLA